MRRPLLRVAPLFAGGIVLEGLCPLPLPLLLGASLALAATALAWSRARCICLCLLIVLAGWTDITLHTALLSPHDLRAIAGQDPQLATVRGVLCETPSLRFFEQGEQESWRTLARIEVSSLCSNKGAWQPATGRVAVSTPILMTNLYAGQEVEVFGVLGLPGMAVAEGTFDYRAYLKQKGIYYQLQAESEKDWRVVASPPRPPLADQFADWGRRALALGLPREDESVRLEWALALGWKPALTEEVSEPFIRAATYHIFAVDGLRMAILFGIFFSLFRALHLSRGVCGMVLLPLLWFYVALTGWPASAIRATVMLTIVIFGWVLKRPVDVLNSLMAAALIILAWDPQQLFQAGFQLSFLVVLYLILMLPPLIGLVQRLTAPDPLLPQQLRRQWPALVRVPLRYAADIFLLTSFAAWLGAIPLVAYYFNIFTPVSTPANLLAVPLCVLTLSSNFASLLLAGWFPAAAELFNHAGWFLMECIQVTSRWFAGWPAAYCYVPAPSLLGTLLYYGLLLAIVTGWLFRPGLRAWKYGAVAVTLVLWSLAVWEKHLCTSLTVLPLHGGTALYLDAPGSTQDLLIDPGTTNSVQFVTKPFLRARGVNHLPALLLTHGDIRHVGGTELVTDLFPVGHVCASPLRFRSPVYRRTLEHLSQRPERFRSVARQDSLGAWTVLHPEAMEKYARADDGTLVLMGDFEGLRVLLLSDLGRLGQEVLLQQTSDLRADIVITGLPSGSEALGDPLLDAIQPRLIIVSDSEFPVSERATPLLRQRLAKRNVPVLFTRSTGALTLEFRGGRCELRAMSGEKYSLPSAAKRDRVE